MEDYPEHSQFEDYHDFYATVLIHAYFCIVERIEFDYTLIQFRYNSYMMVGYPEGDENEVKLPSFWTAAV